MSCLMYTVDFDSVFSKEIVDSPSRAILMKASQQITFPRIKALLSLDHTPAFVKRRSREDCNT